MARDMKDSGIAWIGEIPKDWDISRLLWCLEEIKEKNDPIKTNLNYSHHCLIIASTPEKHWIK